MTAWQRLKEAIRVKARLADEPTDGEMRAIIDDVCTMLPGQKESVWMDVTFRHVRSTGMVKQGGEDLSDLNVLLAQIRQASSGTAKDNVAGGGGNSTGTAGK